MEMGVSLLVHVLVAGFAGHMLDGWLHMSPWGMLGFGFAGFCAWLWQVWKGLHLNVDEKDRVG